MPLWRREDGGIPPGYVSRPGVRGTKMVWDPDEMLVCLIVVKLNNIIMKRG